MAANEMFVPSTDYVCRLRSRRNHDRRSEYHVMMRPKKSYRRSRVALVVSDYSLETVTGIPRRIRTASRLV